MKPALLDTSIWLWMQFASWKIRSETLRDLIEDADQTLYLSSVSVWEMSIKFGLGKLQLPEPPRSLFPAWLLRDQVRLLSIELHHVTYVADLPPHHSDPFDRLLVAQARLEHLTLVSADRQMERYDVDLLPAW
ncbi:MAG: type II toxin-antitoxin system VapC family toxin [Candidatus Eremiobacterota bacterium]